MERKRPVRKVNGKWITASALVLLAAAPAILFLVRGRSTAEAGLLSPLALKADLRTTAVPATPFLSGAEFIVLEEDPAQRVARLLKEANQYYEAGAYDKCAVRAQQAVQTDPGNTEALDLKMRAQNARDAQDAAGSSLLAQATDYFHRGQFDGAALLYTRYLEQHPQSRPVLHPQLLKSYYNLGVIAIRKGRCDLAADYFRQNLLLAGDDSFSRNALQIANQCKTTENLQIDFLELLR